MSAPTSDASGGIRRRWIDGASGLFIALMIGSAAHDLLSEREFQVFLTLAKGETAGDIASALSLSVKTVSTYRTRLMPGVAITAASAAPAKMIPQSVINSPWRLATPTVSV